MSGGLSLGDLVREIPGGVRVLGDTTVRVRGVQQDSRRVSEGDLFVARAGAHTSGLSYLDEACRRGASAVLCAHDVSLPTDLKLPALIVGDVATGMAFAAAAVYGHPSFGLDVVGITGTNGKTTTSHLVRAAIDGALGETRCGVIGTTGYQYRDLALAATHTTPESDELARVLAAMKGRGATHAVMEVSSIALASGRVRAIRFRVGAFTNLTQDHLDYHGSMSRYAAAKKLLFTACTPGVAVINVDDAMGSSLVRDVTAPLLRVSAQTGAAPSRADVAPRSVQMGPEGFAATVDTPAGELMLRSRLVGKHNLENFLLALGIALALDLDAKAVAEALVEERGAPGRLERCDAVGDEITVLVDYAHTPDALARVLDAVRSVGPGRLWCVFGCGGDRDAKKRGPMGDAVGRRADVAIVTNDNPRTEAPAAIAVPIVEGATFAGMRATQRPCVERGYIVELDRARAIERAVLESAPGDIVLIAGKGHEDYQIMGEEKRAFDDRIEARQALSKRRLRGIGPRK